MVSGTFDQQKAVFACQGGAIPHPRVEWSEDGNMDELQIEKIARMGLPS
jgi:hypothetical protein